MHGIRTIFCRLCENLCTYANWTIYISIKVVIAVGDEQHFHCRLWCNASTSSFLCFCPYIQSTLAIIICCLFACHPFFRVSIVKHTLFSSQFLCAWRWSRAHIEKLLHKPKRKYTANKWQKQHSIAMIRAWPGKWENGNDTESFFGSAFLAICWTQKIIRHQVVLVHSNGIKYFLWCDHRQYRHTISTTHAPHFHLARCLLVISFHLISTSFDVFFLYYILCTRGRFESRECKNISIPISVYCCIQMKPPNEMGKAPLPSKWMRWNQAASMP